MHALDDQQTCLLERFRAATREAHAVLDQKFAVIDLTTSDGYGQFLSAHLAGMEPIFAQVQAFARERLAVCCADLPVMLRADLCALGVPTQPAQGLRYGIDPAAAAYVIAGSRLGVAMLSRQDYWGKGSGVASRYMEDRSGLALWRALVPWLQACRPDRDDAARQAQGALAAFGLFAAALDCRLTGQAA